MSEVKLTHEELEAMLDRAARRGAKEALTSIGLLDEDAHRDIHEMRSLLEAWRDTRRSFWTTVVRVITASTLAFIAGAVWMTFDR
jgi:2-iminoacetate synthase ThiH